MPVRIVHNLRVGTVTDVRLVTSAPVKRNLQTKGGVGVAAVRVTPNGTPIQLTHDAEAGVL